MRRYDAVAIGSGINSLVAAALLAKKGWKVCVLERNPWLGGAIRTEEITERGFLHEVYSSWHPLFAGSAAYAELKGDLDARGLEYLNTELATATLFPDGRSVFLTTSHEENVKALGPGWERTVAEFLPNADIAFGLLGTELWSRDGAKLGWKALRRFGRRGLVEFAGKTLTSCRDWTAETFEDERVHGLFAPWVLHTGLGPDAASSGFMAQVIGVAIELGGMPVPRGGGVKLVEALRGIVEDAGGACETGREVERVLVELDRATGVRTADGEVIEATRAVLANVTPQQLYGRLLGGEGPAAEEARRFRFGRGEMQIHFALSEPPDWQGDSRLGRTAIIHLTPGLDGVSRAVNEAERGLLPAEATVVVGQPMAVDPSRRRRAPGSSGSSSRRFPRGRKATRPGARHRPRLDEEAERGLRRPHPGPDRPPRAQLRALDPEAGRPLAGRPGGCEPELRRRRHLLRLVRARPEPDLAPAAGAAGSPDERRALVAHWSEHPPGAGARGGVGHAGREGAAQVKAWLREVEE